MNSFHQGDFTHIEYTTIESAVEQFKSLISAHEGAMSKDVFAIKKIVFIAPVSYTHPINDLEALNPNT
jgi:hypothetical protein